MESSDQQQKDNLESTAQGEAHDAALFYVGLFCEFFAIILGAFTAYIFPYFFLNLNYSVPEFIYHLRQPLEGHLDKAGQWELFGVFLPTLICVILLFFIAKRITIRLEVQHLPMTHEKRRNVRITSLRWYTILLLVVAMVFVFSIFQYVIVIDFMKAFS